MEFIGAAIVLTVLAVAFGLMRWGTKEPEDQKGHGQKKHGG